ncbi:MAG: RNA polymerase sigma factor, partial [Planctomycetes bacterium]|nr:RNA polymerase sigma factor [Planctomycetota bacterium]
ALEHLRPRQRDALLLHYSEGLSVEDVANSLGIPVGTAKTEMHRGRMKLRSLLGGSPEGETA